MTSSLFGYLDKINKILLIGFSIGIAYTLISLPPIHDFIFPLPTNVVARLNYQDSPWYDVEYGAIQNFDNKEGYVFTNDRLEYELVLTKKSSEPVNITAILTYSVGNKPMETKTFSNLVLNRNSVVQQIKYPFSPHEEGINDVKLLIQFFDQDGTYIPNSSHTEDTSFQVLSLGSKLQAEQNTNTLHGIIAASIISAIAVGFTGYQMWQSRNEKILTMRAWIGDKGSDFLPEGVINAQRQRIRIEEWVNMSIQDRDAFAATNGLWVLPIMNFGKIPALNIQTRFIPQIGKKPSRQQLDSKKPSDSFALMPGNEQKVIFQPSLAEFETLLDHSIITYVTIEIKYNSGNSKIERLYGVVFERIPTGFKIVKSWDEKTVSDKTNYE